MHTQSLRPVRLFAALGTVAHQAPLSMGFSQQECWSGLPFPPLGDLPDPGIEPASPGLQADSSPAEPPGERKINNNDSENDISVSALSQVQLQALCK